MATDLLYLLSIWILTVLIGLVSFPITNKLWNRLSDGGFFVGSIFGVICISYINFIIVLIGLFNLNYYSHFASLIIWVAINAVFYWKFNRIDFQKVNWVRIVRMILLFLVGMLFWYWVRAHNPQIYQIERFMDYGFIKSLYNAETLPLYDFWFNGEPVNYYYFGHFLGFYLLQMAFIPSVQGFHMLVVWLFGISLTSSYRIASDAYTIIFEDKKDKYNLISRISGVFGIIFVVWSGTFYSLLWFFEWIQFQLGLLTEEPFFWYADPTRFIDGTITEMPIYGFIVADWHPHTLGIMPAFLLVALYLCYWKNTNKLEKFKLLNPVYLVFSFILGVAYMLNSWDVLTLGLLLAILLGFKYEMYNLPKFNLKYLGFFLMPILAYIFALPWSLFFESPVEGVGIVKEPSNIFKWLAYWGAFVVLIFSIALGMVEFSIKFKSWKDWFKPAYRIFYALIITVFIFWIAQEIFFVKDLLSEGEWYRANTVFKISAQLWVWMGLLFPAYLVYTLVKTEYSKFITIPFLVITVLVVGYYPFKIIHQSNLENNELKGFETGLDWWKEKYPADFNAYVHLEAYRESLPEEDKLRNIVEADGESFEDNNIFSTMLGWRTIIGWPIHEWTWRGSYEPVGARREEVKEIYTGTDVARTRALLDKYDIDFIILGEIEKKKYDNDINYEKLESFGEIFYENSKTKVIKVSER